MADALTPEVVAPLLRGRFGRPYLYRETCESTQRLLAGELGEGAVAVCDEQTAGRGRLGRGWHAPRGSSILCSLLLTPPAERRLAELSLVGGIAAAGTVEYATKLEARIKWPNDVVLKGAKVAGVLAEAAEGAVVLGIGLNVNQEAGELPAGTRLPAGSLLTAAGGRRERGPLLADLLARLEDAYDRWLARGLEALHTELTTRDYLRGRLVEVDGERGTALGIDPRGRLEVELGGQRRTVESGEVSLVAPDQ